MKNGILQDFCSWLNLSILLYASGIYMWQESWLIKASLCDLSLSAVCFLFVSNHFPVFWLFGKFYVYSIALVFDGSNLWGYFWFFHGLVQLLSHTEKFFHHFFVGLLWLFRFLAVQENLSMIHRVWNWPYYYSCNIIHRHDRT